MTSNPPTKKTHVPTQKELVTRFALCLEKHLALDGALGDEMQAAAEKKYGKKNPTMPNGEIGILTFASRGNGVRYYPAAETDTYVAYLKKEKEKAYRKGWFDGEFTGANAVRREFRVAKSNAKIDAALKRRGS